MSRLRSAHDFEANVIYVPGSPTFSDQGRFFGIQRGGLQNIPGLNYLSSNAWGAFEPTLSFKPKDSHVELLDYLSHRRTRLIALLRGGWFLRC